MSETTYIAVAGGANIDIGGKSFQRVIPHDSNPGIVKISLGGVGRNIAHNLALLGVPVKFFTAIGRDHNADLIAESCRTLGIDLHALQAEDVSTSSYLYVADADGDMACAISDMAVCERLTPAYFDSVLDVINGAKAFVMDTNLPQESIMFLAQNVKVPIFVDTVSVTKAARLLGLLPYLHTIKPNRLEAELLTGHKVETAEDAEAAAQILLDKGIRQAYVSLGTEGVLAAQGEERIFFPSFKSETVSLTGAGDAFTAGLVYAYFQDEDFAQAGRTASAAAAIAIQSMETINERMSPGYLRRVIRENKEDGT